MTSLFIDIRSCDGFVFQKFASVLGLVGYSVMKKGIPPVPTESIDSMRRDIQAIKGIGKRSTT